ncbi:hypothetical protein ACJW30_02G207600 [Castanea mollissima]
MFGSSSLLISSSFRLLFQKGSCHSFKEELQCEVVKRSKKPCLMKLAISFSPFNHLVLQTCDAVPSPLNQSGIMKEYSISISFHHPRDSGLHTPKFNFQGVNY